MTVGQTAATDPVEQFLEPTKDLQRRVADLERGALRRIAAQVSWASKVTWNSATTNVVSSGLYQYDGDYINLQAGCSLSGAPANGALSIDLPVAFLVAPGSSNAFAVMGHAFAVSQGVAHGPCGVCVGDGTNLSRLFVTAAAGTLAAWNQTTPWTWKASDAISFNIRYRWR